MKKWKGSYTIEAVFIVPLCVAVVILLLSKTLFLRDVLVSERVAQSAAENGTRYVTQNASVGEAEINYQRWKQDGILQSLYDDTKKADSRVIQEFVDGKMSYILWFADYDGAKVSIDGTKVTVKITISAYHAAAFLGGFGSRWFYQNITVTEQAKNLPDMNRGIMTAWNTGMKIEGLSDLLTRLQERIGKAIH